MDIREKLHSYIDNSDEKLLKMMYVLAKEYNNDEDDAEYIFSAEDIQAFEDRKVRLDKGESGLHSWENAKTIITKRNAG
jgi:hypothetical protein